MSDKIKYVPCICGGCAEQKSKYLMSHAGWGKSYTAYWVQCDKCGRRGKAFNTIDHRNPTELAANAWNTYIARLTEALACPHCHSTKGYAASGRFTQYYSLAGEPSGYSLDDIGTNSVVCLDCGKRITLSRINKKAEEAEHGARNNP